MYFKRTTKIFLSLAVALVAPLFLCVSVIAYDQYMAKPSLKKIARIWGFKQFDSVRFSQAENFERGIYIADLIQSHRLDKKNRIQTEALLGEQSGYHHSESYMTYLVADTQIIDKRWQLVIAFDDNGLFDTVFLERVCCPAKHAQFCYDMAFYTLKFLLRSLRDPTLSKIYPNLTQKEVDRC